MKITVETKIKREIRDVKTGEIVRVSPWEKNLIVDQGLNKMANQSGGSGGCNPASSFTNCLIGNSNAPTSIASGGVTFTQSGFIVTASASFFTSGMVGGLFKYGTGTGGAEYYITVFTSATQVTVDTSATVSTPSAATVWQVQQTALQGAFPAPISNFLYADHYQTGINPNDSLQYCRTTISGNQSLHQRAFVFIAQASTYSVNEIGWSNDGVGGAQNRVNGRIVLGSSDVVSPTNFYVVIIQITFTYSPSAPTSVGNVGTAINTAGTIMLENMQIQQVANSGGVTTNGILDNSVGGVCVFATTTYSQNGSIGSLVNLPTQLSTGVTSGWSYAGTRGTMNATFTFSVSTSAVTAYGVAFTHPNTNNAVLDVLFTTPQSIAAGTFAGTVVWQCVYGRILSN